MWPRNYFRSGADSVRGHYCCSSVKDAPLQFGCILSHGCMQSILVISFTNRCPPPPPCASTRLATTLNLVCTPRPTVASCRRPAHPRILLPLSCIPPIYPKCYDRTCISSSGSSRSYHLTRPATCACCCCATCCTTEVQEAAAHLEV